MPRRKSSEPEDDSIFDELLQRYRADPAYGTQWTQQHALVLIERMRQACTEKNIGELRLVCLPENRFRRDVFTLLTDITLPPTRRGSFQLLEAFVGSERMARYLQEQVRQRDLQRLEWLEQQLRLRKVRTVYGTLSTAAFIERLIADGYTLLIERKRGAATEWFLFNGDGSGYTFRRSIEHEYIERKLSQRGGDAQDGGDG